MNQLFLRCAISFLPMVLLFSCQQTEKEHPFDPSQTLWYASPATNWTEALPVGNGRLGAMVYGKTDKEIIQFNEETLWTGQPHDYAHKDAHQYLHPLRNLLWQGKQDEAEELGNTHFMSDPLRQLSYQPTGEMLLDFSDHQDVVDYKRQLNLQNAVSSVSYEANGVKYHRETFSSTPDQVLVTQLEANQRGALNFSVSLTTLHKKYKVSILKDGIILSGKANNYASKQKNTDYPESKLRFEVCLKIVNKGGQLIQKDNAIEIKHADEVTLLLVAATNFVNYHDISASPSERCTQYLANLQGKTYAQLKEAHIKDYQHLYSRVNMDLGSSELSFRPTIERLISFAQDEDPSMVALLFQYGRYLLISSSRPGTQPANLQGIWNDQLNPAWDSKYTLNINAEMNYWPAEITNLPELVAPLIGLTEDLSVTGRTVAKVHYGMEGWVAHHNTDIWRGAAPINNANHGVWPVGSAWLCEHLWWHYQFSDDKAYLAQRAYPIMKEAAKFYLAYLVPDKEHPEWLVSGPSNSPEQGGMVMGPTMDHQIIRNLFANTIEAAELLGVDAQWVKTLKEKRAKIAPNQIGRYGQLQEWMQDVDDPKNTHRHVSHLWALHPGNEIHPLTTPKLAEACKVTLAHRGDGGTGWSRAWKINFWARLMDGDHAFVLLKNLMRPAGSAASKISKGGGLYANLFDAHPPFQIDGNFGATSGITEMLLQSHLRDANGAYYQDLLPALPSAIANGKVSGIKGRGNFEISITWEHGSLKQVFVKSLAGNNLNLRYAGKTIQQKTKKGESYTFLNADFN